VAYGIPAPGVAIGDLEAGIYAALGDFTKSGPTPEELQGAKTRARADLLRGLASNEELAGDLCSWKSKSGDWRGLFAQPKALSAVTGEDIKRVFQTYFTPKNRTVATLVAPQEMPGESDTEGGL
jgi:predicted Zn-dependent peptidase